MQIYVNCLYNIFFHFSEKSRFFFLFTVNENFLKEWSQAGPLETEELLSIRDTKEDLA